SVVLSEQADEEQNKNEDINMKTPKRSGTTKSRKNSPKLRETTPVSAFLNDTGDDNEEEIEDIQPAPAKRRKVIGGASVPTKKGRKQKVEKLFRKKPKVKKTPGGPGESGNTQNRAENDKDNSEKDRDDDQNSGQNTHNSNNGGSGNGGGQQGNSGNSNGNGGDGDGDDNNSGDDNGDDSKDDSDKNSKKSKSKDEESEDENESDDEKRSDKDDSKNEKRKQNVSGREVRSKQKPLLVGVHSDSENENSEDDNNNNNNNRRRVTPSIPGNLDEIIIGDGNNDNANLNASQKWQQRMQKRMEQLEKDNQKLRKRLKQRNNSSKKNKNKNLNTDTVVTELLSTTPIPPVDEEDEIEIDDLDDTGLDDQLQRVNDRLNQRAGQPQAVAPGGNNHNGNNHNGNDNQANPDGQVSQKQMFDLMSSIVGNQKVILGLYQDKDKDKKDTTKDKLAYQQLKREADKNLDSLIDNFKAEPKFKNSGPTDVG
ncbi:MAG: hypothetical protein ACPG2Y_02720, partial [Acholeplasmataceae bacterium]